MRQRNLLARLFRALSEDTQKEFARRTGVDAVLLARYELDQVEPGLDHLERLAAGAGVTVDVGERILKLADTLRQSRSRGGVDIEALTMEFAAQITAIVFEAYDELLRMPPSEEPCMYEEPWMYEEPVEVWERLKYLGEEDRVMLVQLSLEFRRWDLARLICEESAVEVSRDPGTAVSLARLALEIAERVRGTDDWRRRVQGYAAVHLANALRAAGELKEAEEVREQARQLWESGADLDQRLDPELLDLETRLGKGDRSGEEE